MKGGKMMSKKAQQDVIVTVLLVLIALAAVALIATFIIKNVKTATQTADDKQNCLKLEFNIGKADVTSNRVLISRSGANVSINAIQTYVDGTLKNVTSSIDPGNSITLTLASLTAGQKVEVAGILSDGYACTPSAEQIAA